MSAANFGQSEKSQLGMGFFAAGDGPPVIDPLAQDNRAASLRAELAAIEGQLRDLQARYSTKLALLVQLEEAGGGV